MRLLRHPTWITTSVFVLLTRVAFLGVAARVAASASQFTNERGIVPVDLGPEQFFAGVPWTGEPGITETVGEIMARQNVTVASSSDERRIENPLHVRSHPKQDNPDAPAVAQWPPAESAASAERRTAPSHTVGTNWVGTHQADACCVTPPDSMGAAGTTQVLVLSNGRFKVYDKAGNLGSLNVSADTFFASVHGGFRTSDPHVRFDRLSGRWFITMINIANFSNRILIAVSSGSAITSTSSFTFFQFQHDLVGTTPNPDTGGFADYDTLGVDANALYIGINEFGSGGSPFLNTTAYVVNKANLLSGTLTVTAFRGLISGSGPVTPQGVDNDTPGVNEGYFIGVDDASFGRLAIRRISNPGGTPSISGNIFLTVPATCFPVNQVQQGSFQTLKANDDRLLAAAITKNQVTGVSSLWTAHNIAVGSTGSCSGTRNAMRWYQIDNLTAAPTLTQSGTLFDSAATNPRGFWMGSVAASSQGHMVLGASFAGAADFAGVVATSRLSGDTLGSIQSPVTVVTGAGAYSDFTGNSAQRWGDYSQVVVDPADGQTMWTFQDYAFSTSTLDSWGVRVVKLVAPPPATPVSAIPTTIGPGLSSATLTITGTSSSGSAFFDPGSDFVSRIAASIAGGVTVNSITFVNAITVQLNVSTVGATTGAKNVTITNPDGQSASGNSLFNVTSGFTDDPIGTGSTPVKAVHITELRTRINGARARFCQASINQWTDPSLSGVAVKATHVTELRTALIPALVAAGRSPAFTDDPLNPGQTSIKATHVSELRLKVLDLESLPALSC